MTNNEINNLLKRFYDGQTSLEEERCLKEFFRNGEIDDSLMDDKMMFDALSEIGDRISVPDNLENDISALIDSLDKKSGNGKILRWIPYTAAAIIVLALCIVSFLPHKLPQDTFTANVEMTETEAISKFEESMALLSKGFEMSCSTAKRADETLEKTVNIVVKSVK